MTIAGNDNLTKDTRLTAKSYHQDGLVEMYDPIENLGFGLSDTSSKTWVPCVGSKNINLNEDEFFDGKSVNLTSTKTSVRHLLNYYGSVEPFYYGQDLTLECNMWIPDVTWSFACGASFLHNQYGVNGFLCMYHNSNTLLQYSGFLNAYSTQDHVYVNFPDYISIGQNVTQTLTYDSKNRIVNVYLNGNEVGSVVIPQEYDVWQDDKTTNEAQLMISNRLGNTTTVRHGCTRLYFKKLNQYQVMNNYRVDYGRFCI